MISRRGFVYTAFLLMAVGTGTLIPKWQLSPGVSGVIRDEGGRPIEGARIEYTFAQSMFEGLGDKAPGFRKKGETYSDKEGRFSFPWEGVSVYVVASKGGYYNDKASQGEQRKGTPSPLLLSLRKGGDRQNLLRNEMVSKPVPVTGSAIDIHLGKPDLVAEGQGHVRLAATTSADGRSPAHDYDWTCHLSVPGGGMLERTDKFQFEAPTTGYKPTIEVRMSRAITSARWRDGFEKDLFVKLRDGTFARIKISFRTEPSRARLSCISWWNQSGSTNLEAGPTEFGGLNQN